MSEPVLGLLAAPLELELSSVTLEGVAVPLAGIAADVTIRHGRAGFFDSASPSTAQLTLLGVTRAMMRPFRLGSLLVVNATDGSTVAPRFTGRLTDAALVDDELTAIAVGRLRTLSGYTVGAAAYPEEAWSARVTRAFTEAGLAAVLELAVGTFDPIVVARPIEPVTLASMLDELAAWVQAAVCDRPDGRIFVQALGARSVGVVTPLDPAEVAYAPVWEQRLPGANVLTVSYGEANPQAVATASDAASVALYGPIPVTITTELKSAADANQVLQNRLGRDAFSHWTIPGAPLLVGRRFSVGQAVRLSLLPSSAPYDPWSTILEGWTDHVTADADGLAWSMDLALSDPLLSGITLSWAGTPSDAAHQWNTINQAVAWRDALTLDSLTP